MSAAVHITGAQKNNVWNNTWTGISCATEWNISTQPYVASVSARYQKQNNFPGMTCPIFIYIYDY